MRKKSILLFFIFLSIFKENYGQSPYYDAVELHKLMVKNIWPDNEATRNAVTTILSHYCRRDEIDSVFLTNNPFIRDFASGWTNRSGNSFHGGLNIASVVSSIGGVDVTKFANAIAEIMIDRAKQELTIAFFNRFKKFSQKNPEFQIMFPKTTENLSNLLSYKYPQMLPALRDGFFEDLEKITYHLDDVLELPRYRHLLRNFPQVTLAIRSIRLIHELETGNYTAADIIRESANFKEWGEGNNAAFKNMGSTIKFASVISESLRYKDETHIWVDSKDIKDLMTDEILMKIYIGLIYQQIKTAGIKIYTDSKDLNKTENLCDFIAEEKDNIILFQNKISEFINLADRAEKAYNVLKKKLNAGEKIVNEDVYNYISNSVDIADYAFSIVKIFNQDLVSDKYLAIARKSNSLYKDIYSQQYTQAVSDAVDIITEVHDLTSDDNNDPGLPAIGKPAYNRFALDKKSALKKLEDFVIKVKPYALFMANVVEAKDDKEVKAALESVMLPVGSSSIKKYAKCNVSVQTYLGAFLSTSNGKSSVDGTWSDKFGVTAPIGISYTPGLLSWQKGGSLSLFGALFDIGAIVDYRLKKEQDITNSDPNATVVSKDYRVKLGNIFSPGVYVVYGVGGNLPLSLGFGAQYGPGLSKIVAGNNNVLLNPSWRWTLFLAVDMPFFNLVNKSKERK